MPSDRLDLGELEALPFRRDDLEQGVGAGVVPVSAVLRAGRAMAISVVPLADDWTARTLVVAVRRGVELSPHARALVAHLVRFA